MSPFVILISGKQGSGKSTLAQALYDDFRKREVITLQMFKFADPLYTMMKAVLDVADEYNIRTTRPDKNLLQLLGTEWGRKTLGEDIWVDCMRTRVEKFGAYQSRYFPDQQGVVIIDDCRFPNELVAFPEALKIRLTCSEVVRKARAEGWRKATQHSSETALDYLDGTAAFNLEFDTVDWPTDSIVRVVVGEYLEKKE